MSYTLPDGKLSPSRVSTFNRCPACYEWIYILKQPARIHIALPRGIAVHAGVQSARVDVMAGSEIHDAEAIDIAVDTFDKELKRIDPEMLDLGSSAYKVPEDAAGDVVELTKTAIASIVRVRDERVGINQCEARVDYTGIFPFEFEAYLDVMLADGTFADLKTANRAETPDVWAFTQVRLYALPWWKQGQPVQMCIDQVALPTAKFPIPRVNFYTAGNEDEKFRATEKLVLDTAAAISSGVFPARPGYWCKVDHSLAA